MERTVKELLIIIRDNTRVTTSWFGLKQRISSGLCSEISYLTARGIITFYEKMLLYKYMENHRPINARVFDYWWKERLWNPRLKWLNKQISSL